jgi:hypothetical protein
MPSGRALDAVLLPTQAGRKGVLNSVWADGWQMHADLHAGLTLALWPLLRPAAELAQAAQ